MKMHFQTDLGQGLTWGCEKKYVIWDLPHWKRSLQSGKFTGEGAKLEFSRGERGRGFQEKLL